MRIGTIGLSGLLGAAVVTYVVARSGGTSSAEVPPATKAADGSRPLPAELLAPIDATPQDDDLVKKLDKKISLDVKERPLDEVLRQVGKLAAANIVFERGALVTHFFDLASPVTLEVKDVPLRIVLRLILKPHSLTYVVHDGVFLITHQEKNDVELITRLYPVADVAGSVPPGQFDDMVDELIKVVLGTIEPESWEDNGGSGVLEFFSPALTLVVTTSDEVHERLRAFFTKLREAQERARAQLRAAGLPELAALQKALYEARQQAQKGLFEETRPEAAIAPPNDEIEALRKQAADAHRVAEKALRLALQLEKELADLKAERKPPAASEKTQK